MTFDEAALALLDKLKIGRILRGYRGALAHDIDKIVRDIVALGRLATDLADVIESLDVNPLVSRPGFAPVALDAAVGPAAAAAQHGSTGR